MSLLKFLFVSTAVGAVAVTAPVVFVTGKMFGKIEERHQISKKDVEPVGKMLFKHEAESTPWSDTGRTFDSDETVAVNAGSTSPLADKPEKILDGKK